MNQNNQLQNQVRQISPEEVERQAQGRQLSQEELQKTQVLNLQAVEEAARYERLTSKKPAIIIGIIGIVLLTFGTGFQILKTVSSNENHIQKRENKTPVEEEEITVKTTNLNCSKTVLNNPDGTDTIYTITYNLEDDKLVGFTKTFVAKATIGVPLGIETIQAYENAYQNFLNPVNGYAISVVPAIDHSQITTTVTVNLEALNISTLPEIQQTHFSTKVDYPIDTPVEQIQTDMLQQGIICE